MSDTNFQDVRQFMLHLGYALPERPQLLPQLSKDFRLKLLHEELQELETALRHDDIVETADALVDLSYVTLGTAAQLGLPWAQLWREVHASNMLKFPGVVKKRQVHGQIDAVKPPGWVPPDLRTIILEAMGQTRLLPWSPS